MDNSSAPIKLEPLKKKKTTTWPRWRRRKGPRALRDIRERAGISLATVSERTRIPLHHLEEIERGDVTNLPPGVYAKSWAREYAHEIGVDEQTVLEAVAPVAGVEESIEEIRQVREDRDRKRDETAAVFAPVLSSELARKIVTAVVVLALLALAAVSLWRVTAPQ